MPAHQEGKATIGYGKNFVNGRLEPSIAQAEIPADSSLVDQRGNVVTNREEFRTRLANGLKNGDAVIQRYYRGVHKIHASSLPCHFRSISAASLERKRNPILQPPRHIRQIAEPRRILRRIRLSRILRMLVR